MYKQLVIVGGGPAGLAAAIEAKKNGIDDILIIERDKSLGGILQQCIHNGFGLHIFGEQLTGPEYAQRFIDEAKELKIDYVVDSMVIDVTKDRILTVVNPENGLFNIEAGAIVFAMGCRERSRGALNIPGTRPSGIFTAGAAQRFVNMEGYMVGKEVVILGSGDIGLIMARRMTLEGAHVNMVLELMPYSSGLKRNIVQCVQDFDIPMYFSTTVIRIHGSKRLEGVTIANVDKNRKPILETQRYVPCDTLLLSVGLIPENEISMSAGVQMDSVTSGPVVNESMETSIPGVFASGNVVHVHDLVDFVTQESRLSGIGAARYLKGELKCEGHKFKTCGQNGIRYVVPQIINADNVTDSVNFFMRSGSVYKNVYIEVKDGEKVLMKLKRNIVTPGEMENVVIKKDALMNIESGKLTFEIGEASK